MATLIDSLLVELKLDPTEFTKGQKRAAESFLKTREEAVKSSKAIEEASKAAAAGVKKIAVEALALFAVFTGSRSIKDFASSLAESDAALGRFSKSIGTAPQTIAAWEKAAERMGGTSQAAAASIKSIANAFADLQINGKALPDAFYQLQGLTGLRIDTEHGVAKFLDDTAAALQKLNAIDPNKARFLASGLGIDDATANVMIKYGAAVHQYIESLKDLGPTAEQAKAAQDLQDRWVTTVQQIQNLAEKGFRALEPALTEVLTKMDGWIARNKEWIDAKVIEYANQLGEALKRFMDWISSDEGKASLRAFGDEVKSIFESIAAVAKLASDAMKVVSGQKVDNGDGTTSRHPTASDAPKTGKGSKADPYDSLSGTPAGSYYKNAYGQAVQNTWDWIEEPKTGRATGGPVTAGRAYMVGERGPEPFIPNTSGSIIPNDKLGGNLQVDGRPINRGNPMPVSLANGQGGGSENWLQTLIGMFSGGSGGGGSGGGFLSAVGGAIKSAFGGNTDVKPVGNSAGTRGWWTAERQKYAYDYLRKHAGLSDAGAKGLLSRWVNVEAAGGPGSSNNIGGGHYGIAQWSRSRGKSIWGNPNFEAQLALAVKELNGPEKKAGDYLRKATTDKEGAVGASMFERAENYNPSTGIDDWTGKTLGGMRGLNQILTGAKGAAIAAGRTTNDNRRSSSTSNVTNVNGPITVTTQARDADGIAGSLHDSIRRNATASAANNGPN